MYDRDDPSRPRFTMTELKEILYERNELKARVSDLEDELEVYRPREQHPYVQPWRGACDVAVCVVVVQVWCAVVRLCAACVWWWFVVCGRG